MAAVQQSSPSLPPGSAPRQGPLASKLSSTPEWSDLTPIPQADTENPMVAIAYTAEYRDSMDLFRALVQREEFSERGLDLTTRIIKINPAHYSVWSYRARTLLSLHEKEPEKDYLDKELDLMDSLVKAHLKSYQIWQHRRNVVMVLADPSRELPFVEKALAIDSKNYHTWAYRQWVLCHFDRPDMWAGELKFTDYLLHVDVRNNSAWNHRFFLVFESGRPSAAAPNTADKSPSTTSSTGEADAKVYEREWEYVKSKILLAPNNASAWNYLRGILKKTNQPLATCLAFAYPLGVAETSSEMLASVKADAKQDSEGTLNPGADLPAVAAAEFLADALSEEEATRQRSERPLKAAIVYRELEENLDPIRKRYWAYKRKLVERHGGRKAGEQQA